jgi:hypothetical protein
VNVVSAAAQRENGPRARVPEPHIDDVAVIGRQLGSGDDVVVSAFRDVPLSRDGLVAGRPIPEPDGGMPPSRPAIDIDDPARRTGRMLPSGGGRGNRGVGQRTDYERRARYRLDPPLLTIHESMIGSRRAALELRLLADV